MKVFAIYDKIGGVRINHFFAENKAQAAREMIVAGKAPDSMLKEFADDYILEEVCDVPESSVDATGCADLASWYSGN